MENKKLFIKALTSMLYSGGGDPTPETYWALDEFKEFYEAETGHIIDAGEYDEEGDWASRVIEAMKQGPIQETKENFNRLI